MNTRNLITRGLLVTAFAACCLVRAAESSGSPLLAHYDFESTDAHAVWKEMPGKDVKPSHVSLDTANAHSGTAALKFQATSVAPSARFLFTGINVPADHPGKVRVRLYARTEAVAAGEAEINLLERDKTKVLGWTGGKNVLISLEPSEQWKDYTAEVPIQAETKVLTLFVRINSPAEGKTIWIDDVSVEFVEPQ